MTTLGHLFDSSPLPRHEILALAVAAAGLRREVLLADPDRVLQPAASDRVRGWITRREQGEPLAYLVGRREFYGRLFRVGPSVLIPRADTEVLVDRAIAWIDAGRAVTRREPVRVLELGTGSGAIGVTLALERAGLDIVATDVSPSALDVARRNADQLGARLAFVESDWFRFLEGRGAAFDLIVSNPPYIAADDSHLGQGDLVFEPRLALTDGADGLCALRHIVSTGRRHIARGGALMVEHGHAQAAAVRALFVDAGFEHVASTRDLSGIERVTSGANADRREGGRHADL